MWQTQQRKKAQKQAQDSDVKVEKKQKKVQRLLMVIKRAQQVKKPHLFNKIKSQKPAKKELKLKSESRKKHKAHKEPVKGGKQREAAKKKEAEKDYKFDLRHQIAESRADENDQKAFVNKYVHK